VAGTASCEFTVYPTWYRPKRTVRVVRQCGERKLKKSKASDSVRMTYPRKAGTGPRWWSRESQAMLFKAFDCTPYGIARTASRTDGADERKVKCDGVEPERGSVNRAKCRSRSCQCPYADQTKIRLMHMGRQDMLYNSSPAHSSIRLNPSFARTRRIPRPWVTVGPTHVTFHV
jgi:hypothetical protein